MPLYHVWFATKRRKWMLQGDVADAVRELMSEIASDKKIELLEHEAIVDHVHLLLRAKDKPALSRAMNDLKGVSARRIFQRFPELKIDANTNAFWQARYGHKLVPGSAESTIRKYIRTQWERLEDYDR
jgi:putative transposase